MDALEEMASLIRETNRIRRNGYEGEYKALWWLYKKLGVGSVTSSADRHFDAICLGKKIEVKTGIRNRKGWTFILSRKGVFDETGVDFYILRLENYAGDPHAIHLIVPAPIGMRAVRITLSSLMEKWSKFYDRFDLIRDAE